MFVEAGADAGGGSWCRCERERKSRAAQGRLLTEGAAWRSFRTSKQAATVTGKRGSIYYWEYYNYFCRAYSTGGRSCKVGARLYFAFQVGKNPQNVSASHVKMGEKREKMSTQRNWRDNRRSVIVAAILPKWGFTNKLIRTLNSWCCTCIYTLLIQGLVANVSLLVLASCPCCSER